MNDHPEFDKWWEEHGQYVRADGGQYEISFAFAAWQAARATADRDSADAWISVDDHLPINGKMVAVYDPNHPELKIWPATWDSENEAFTAGNYPSAGWFEKGEVTHWMPLPVPPTDTLLPVDPAESGCFPAWSDSEVEELRAVLQDIVTEGLIPDGFTLLMARAKAALGGT